MMIQCTRCSQIAEPLDWQCTACGGMLTLAELPFFQADRIRMEDTTLWRYSDWLPVKQHITLGEGMTPLVPTNLEGQEILLKLEYLNPTGSYKDRGTTTMMNHFIEHQVQSVIDDSSGNAGASVAAYASAAGIRSRIFVPATASEAKKTLIKVFGGELAEIAGPQHAKTEACQREAKTITYASHAWSPYFLLGQMTAGFEIWEQTIGHWPDAIIVPVGHGALFTGIAQGLARIQQAGLIDRVPAMFAVQSEKIDPIVQAFEAEASSVQRVDESGRTIADGIMVNQPSHGDNILKILRETGGAALRVSDAQIQAAQMQLARKGFIAEPTSAATVASLPQVQQRIGLDKRIVCALTGNALKYVYQMTP